MEETVQTIITQLPNLAVALWMLYQQQLTIKSLMDNQSRLIDRLLHYVDQDEMGVSATEVAAAAVAVAELNGKP